MLIIIKELEHTQQVMPSAIAYHSLIDAQTKHQSKQWPPANFASFFYVISMISYSMTPLAS